MNDDLPFAEVMARLRAGDEDAASLVLSRFTNRLIALARSRFDRLLQQKLDPEDVLQSVYRSFFCAQAEGRFQLENWESLWGMLTVMTLRKCGHRIEHFRAARRDVTREVSGRSDKETSHPGWEVMADDPTPSQALMLAETLETLMEQLSERERQIVTLRLQGHSTEEISETVQRSERTVQRVLHRVKLHLESQEI